MDYDFLDDFSLEKLKNLLKIIFHSERGKNLRDSIIKKIEVREKILEKIKIDCLFEN